ncbi:MAG TPA: VOC family protein [Terriglobales bacterium]|jgi:predicted enzyme related to lactoylglutathione lyase|nr:VOC family protein [Terriglobales bacterium]
MEKKIAVVIVGVTDMQRAVDFYRSTLRLPLKFQTPTYSEFKTEGAVLALEKRDEVHANGPSFTLPTRNAKRDREALRRRKVKFWKDLSKEPYGWVMMAKDSEGNVFEIVQYVTKK